jgi:hypothetical protein
MEDERTLRWSRASSYAVFYGQGEAKHLAKFDAAVVEPLGQSAESLVYLHQQSTLVLAYLSVMETSDAAPGGIPLGPNDFLHWGNERLINPEFGSYLLDLRSPRWQRSLLYRAGRLLTLGYDGIFLDTIGDVEDPRWPPLLRAELVSSATRLVRELRQAYPRHLLVQNNGLRWLLSRNAAWLDGVCLENPPPSFCTANQMQALSKRLVKLSGQRAVRLLLLQEQSRLPSSNEQREQQSQSWVERHRVLRYFAPDNYLQVAAKPRTPLRQKENSI